MNVRTHRASRSAAPARVARRTRFPALAAVLLLLVALASAALAASCASPPAPTPVASRASTPTEPPEPTAAPTTSGTREPQTMTLRWWTPEFLSPQAPQPVGPILASQLAAFSAAAENQIQVETVRKARYGKGGLLDMLRTAQPVARSILPDLIALDAAELGKAVDAGLVQPLDELVDPAVTEKLYPFASEAGLFNEHLYGVQYLADIDHAAYRPAQVVEAPNSWAGLVSQRITYLFPLAPPQTASSQGATARPAEALSHAVLGQYLSAGATLGPDRRLLLELQPLVRLLTFYSDASGTGVLPPVALDLPDGDAVWNVFSQGQAPLAYISARRYMGRGDLPAQYAPAVGYEGGAVSIASGWMLAIVTTDPERQRAAADLIAWLLQPENAGAWAARAGWLPTSSEALKALGTGPYWTFLDAQMAQARALPVGSDYAATANRIQTAIQNVVSAQGDPEAAAEGAVSGQ